jgi:glycosyltransferase involved in cell wall biosynthesis
MSQPNYPLAVLARRLGTRSETFIHRHMADLLPGRTALVVLRDTNPTERQWTVEAPTLTVDQVRLKAGRRRWPGGPLNWRRTEDAAVVADFLRRYGVQAWLGEYLDLSVAWLGAAVQAEVRFYAHAHGVDVSRRLREPGWAKRYLAYNEAAGVITVAEHSRQKLIALGLAAERIHVVPCGVDVPETLPPRPERHEVRCLAVGRMVAKKAPIYLLDAFRRAAAARPELHLDYIGDGELLPAARQFLRAMELEGRVTLYGGQPSAQVFALAAQADLFLQHSITDPDTGDEEGLPVAILEAMAHALPVISTRHAGIPEAVQEGETGLLVAEGDTVGMAERLVSLATDPDARARMGAAGRARVKAQFSWERERTELLRIMELDRG